MKDKLAVGIDVGGTTTKFGIVNSKGEIVAQGKRVDKVLVDGEEFFGDDPTMATQNISAKAVDRVQVFETKTSTENKFQTS